MLIVDGLIIRLFSCIFLFYRQGAVYKKRVVKNKRTRSTTFDYTAIDAPYDITLCWNMWFVTEPTFNRVATFSHDFKDWLGSFDR